MFEARKEAKLLDKLNANELFISDLYKVGRITYDQAVKAIGYSIDFNILRAYGEISSYLYEIKDELVNSLQAQARDEYYGKDEPETTSTFKMPDHSDLEAQMKKITDKGIVLKRDLIHEYRANAALRILDLIKLNLETDKKATPFEAISIWRDSISCKSKKLSFWTYKYIEREDKPRIFNIKDKRTDVIHEAPEEFILKEIGLLIPLATKMDTFCKGHDILKLSDFTGELQEEFEKDPAFSSDIPSREEIEKEYYDTALRIAREEVFARAEEYKKANIQ